MYGIKDVSKVEGVVVVDHQVRLHFRCRQIVVVLMLFPLPQSLLYYDTDAHGRPLGLDEDAIFSALRLIYAGKGTPKHSENMLERIARVRRVVFHA